MNLLDKLDDRKRTDYIVPRGQATPTKQIISSISVILYNKNFKNYHASQRMVWSGLPVIPRTGCHRKLVNIRYNHILLPRRPDIPPQ